MGPIQGKVWGTTQLVLAVPNLFELHRITIVKGGHCSEHKHEFKFNAFIIEKGKLKVKVWKNDYKLTDETIVENQQLTIAAPMEFHSFEAIEEVIAYEAYWSETNLHDIVRRNCGGVK